jgi:hypothetical protein
MIRTLSILAAAAAALLAFWRLEPGVDAARARLDDARARLRSDAIVLAARPHFLAERRRLSRRYGAVVTGATESDVLRALADASKRFGIEFVSGNVTTASAPLVFSSHSTVRPEFDEVRLAVELRGSYRGLLLAIDALTRNAEMTRVDGISLRGNGQSLDASIPLTLLRPNRSGS